LGMGILPRRISGWRNGMGRGLEWIGWVNCRAAACGNFNAVAYNN
jgi:hypothetical protein